MTIFNYRWTLAGANFAKDRGAVFSCFACGGGSTMGYKLAGFDVLGFNEIDPKMADAYVANHRPRFQFVEPIQTFKLRQDLPLELFDLDILDGSPPCSSFSMAGAREKHWGKEKKFREGQALQVLDTLFFDFIDLAARLRPKVVIAENVKGLLLGSAQRYVKAINESFDRAGYAVQHWLLNAADMGVPQRRERVFFVALRKDLADAFSYQKDLFTIAPRLDLVFNEKQIPFKDIEDVDDQSTTVHTRASQLYAKTAEGRLFSTAHETGSFYSDYKVNRNEPVNTIVADPDHGAWHYNVQRMLNTNENILAGSFPKDYDFRKLKPKYLIGMSVPPVMMAQIARQVDLQWLTKLKGGE